LGVKQALKSVRLTLNRFFQFWKTPCAKAGLVKKILKEVKKVLDFLFTIDYNIGEHCSTNENYEPLASYSHHI
jgi:hypothetical protein